MEKRLKEYLAKMEQFSMEGLSKEKKERARQEMLVQIQFFQHERLIHLIVTVTFALLTVISVLGFVATTQIGLLLLTIMLLVLLVPYIRHYYILENGVQRLYRYYDDMVNSIEDSLKK